VTLRKQIELEDAGETVVIFRGAEAPRHQGKYLVGRHRIHSHLHVVAFDDSAQWHREIAFKHGIAPAGGGWLEADHAKKRIHLSGFSHAYGREPRRAITAAAFKALLPDYDVTFED
jgi:hypothetical protein